MSISNNSNQRSPLVRRSLASTAAIATIFLLVASCSSVGSRKSPPTETRDASGFSIQETQRVGLGMRANFERANSKIEAGEIESGIEMLEAIAVDAPSFAAVQINLGIAYQRVSDFEKAESALRAAIDANSRHPVAHNELGIVYRRTGRFDLARSSFETALKLKPEFHYARKNLAILCDLYLNEVECALENYTRYRDDVPEDSNAEIWIADLQARAGR